MNKIRTHIKWISAFMVIVLMMTVMPFNLIHVSATELDTVRFIIDSVSARAGETIEINAVLENAFNVKAISASNIVYDETKVSLINVEWLCDATMSDWNMSLGLGAVTFSENTNANGSVLKMTFRVKESISDSDVDVTCSATVKTLNDTDDEIELNIEIIPGVISIRNPLRGDVDGNGKINTNDAIRLLYFVSFGGTRFPINQNGDMNGDNKVNTNDAVCLLYHVSFGNDRFPLFEACVTHHLVAHVQNAPTCTEAGNSEYWHCTKCGKYFADADGNKEITIESTIVEAKGHSYSTVWSFDTEYHWHDASCGCDDAGTIDKAKHIVDKDGHCACGYSAENNYTVQYYWENIDDSGYTLHETVSGYAPVGSVVNAEIKKYEHFNAVDSSVSATIDSIDITVLKVYYRRDVYTITFDPNGGRLFGTAVQKVKYGGNAVLPEFERDPDDNFFYEIDRYDGIYENVQGDATVTVIWKSRRMNELSAPSNVAIDNDTVSWSAVENAASYIVTAGDYSFETKSTSCALSRLKNADGETIVDYGTIDVTVTAVGKSGYKNATSSAIQNFYVPETKGADYDELYKWNIGHGYNLIENEYLKLNEFRSNLAVFNLGKLMTIGTADINSKNNQTTYDAYSFSSVDDYMSQLNIDFNTSASVGANASFWKFKAAATLKTALGLSMSTTLKEYNNIQIIFYNFYVSQGIKSIKFKESDEKLLKYSLSNTFVKDIMRRSNGTKDYVTNEQLPEYIYKTYGTHAILGVTPGGILSSTYVAATNPAELAATLTESSSVDSSAEAGGS